MANRRCRTLMLLSAALGTAACQVVVGPTPPTDPSQLEYTKVEWSRLTSGAFVDEYDGKYVRLECSFMSTAGGIVGGYDSTSWVSFLVDAPRGAGSANSVELLKVVAPKEVADSIFALRNGDEITLRGMARRVTSRRPGGSTYPDLILEAYIVDKRAAA